MNTPQVLAGACPRPKLIRPGEGEHIERFGDSARFLLTGAQSGGRVLLCHSEDSPGAGPLLCVHQNEDVLFIVESGCYEWTLGHERTEAGPGTIIFVPRLLPHTFRVIADETSRMWSAYWPAGFEEFQRLFASECATGAPQMSRIAQLGKPFGVTFLAPEAIAQHDKNRATVVKSPQSRNFEGSERALLSAEETSGALSLVEWQMSPGSNPVWRTQRHEDAIFLIRAGCWEFEIDGARVQTGPGCVVFAPCPHPHSLRVIGTEAGNLLLLSFPVVL